MAQDVEDTGLDLMAQQEPAVEEEKTVTCLFIWPWKPRIINIYCDLARGLSASNVNLVRNIYRDATLSKIDDWSYNKNAYLQPVDL